VHAEWHTLYSDLLELRRRFIVPHLAGGKGGAEFAVDRAHLSVDWRLGDGSRLHLRANFSDGTWTGVPAAPGQPIFGAVAGAVATTLAAWSALWTLEPVRG
jgi:maltooligosyltrehalose trehalohydrolase